MKIRTNHDYSMGKFRRVLEGEKMKTEITMIIIIASIAIGYMASHTERVDTSECYLVEVDDD